MKRILRQYEKLIFDTKNNDDWKSLDISRVNLYKFLNEKKTFPEYSDIKNDRNNAILIHNNVVKNYQSGDMIKVFYDKKKILNKLRNNKLIKDKIKNLNYIFSPYFINIIINDKTNTEEIKIKNFINYGIESFHHQRNVIKVGNDCNVTIIEEFHYTGNKTYLSNIYSEIYIGKNSKVNYYCIKHSDKNNFQIFNQNSYIGENAHLKYFVFSYGKGIQYIKKTGNLLNINGKLEINNISYTNKKEKKSINLNVNHFVQNCYSKINTKGIFNSHKESSVIGKINIKKNCKNSKAFFQSDNLITIKSTKVNIRPILKIYNKDVVCSHGTTIGFLNKEEIFYLQSRGISYQESEKILKHCFIKPSVDVIKIKKIRKIIKKILGLNGISV